MGQIPEEIRQNFAERLDWQLVERDHSRMARRLYRKPVVDGVYRLDEGAVLEDFCHFLQVIGVMALLEQVHGVTIPREMVNKPFRPFDNDDDRCLIEHGCIKEAKQPRDLGYPPQNTERIVRVQVVFTLLMFALATA